MFKNIFVYTLICIKPLIRYIFYTEELKYYFFSLPFAPFWSILTSHKPKTTDFLVDFDMIKTSFRINPEIQSQCISNS